MQIQVYGSGLVNKDLIQQTDYDGLHRPEIQYLPVPSNSDNKGSFSSVGGNSFYKQNSNNVISGADQFYSQTIYESSPLNRVSELKSPGITGNGVRSAFKVSDGNIKRYQAGTGLTDISLPSQANTYAAGELTYTETKDENDKTVQQYTDYQGRTVLKRVFLSGTDYLDTYYVYGATGQLRAVLQPEFQEAGNDDVNRYAFLYRYDARGNLIEKKVPGAAKVTMTYDGRDRLETMTDGNSKVFRYTYENQLNRLTHIQLAYDNISVNYYDNYPAILTGLAFQKNVFPEWVANAANYFLKDSENATEQTQGLLTASDQYLFNADGNRTNEFLRTITYYNKKGQIIQVARQLYGLSGGATERISYLLDFSGKVIRERTDQFSSSWSFHLEKGFIYDHMDRLVKVMHRVWQGDYATATVKQYTHSEITYDEVGQPKTKKLHGGIQEFTYKNHLRGWLGTVRSPAFDLTLQYFANGNIENLGWQAGGRNGNLQMTYDGANRLQTATGGDSFDGNSESLTYDKNGNIKTLQRREGNQNIDALTYTYTGNTLKQVEDGWSNSAGFTNDASASDEMSYDANGNLTEDKNRSIKLSYNPLNLISKVKKGNDDVLFYVYDASGTKHQLSSSQGTTSYAGAFEYQGEGNLKRIAIEEGQIVRQGASFTVQYYLRDHLGNVRVVLNETGQAQQVTEYHAFGKAISQTGNNWQTNRYLYNGKELQPETEYLDYGARQYDPILGRWMSIDPLTDKQEAWSPYHYVYSDPINNIDPDGRIPNPINILRDLFRTFRPQTTNNLISSAARNGYFNDPSARGMTRLGRIYEDAVIRSLGENSNTRNFRVSMTSPRSVRPDMVGSTGLTVAGSDNESINFPNASFVEIKFKSKVSLNDRNNPDQMKGFIDVLSNMRGGYINGEYDPTLKASNYGQAILTLITPSGATVDSDLIEYATSRNVRIYQRTVQQDQNDPARVRVAPGVTPLNRLPSFGAEVPKFPGQSVEINWKKK